MPCLDDNTVLELVSGTLRAPDQERAQLHLDECAACRALVAEASPAPEATLEEWEHLQIGAQLGRYRITDVIGAGAMGYVFAATDLELGRTVALKLLRASGAEAEALRPRLLREAQALAKLSHPNVVAVHDVGTFGDHLFVALEWIDGGTLTEWLRPDRSVSAIVGVFRQAGEGLAAAHAAGLVHRDVKPDNMLVGKDGRVRVTDFGLAAEIADGETPRAAAGTLEALRLTATGVVVGTPAYLSPEQVDGQAGDVRSDQFSFCVAMFEALHGEKPFAGDDWPALRTALLAGSIVRVTDSRVPRWIDRIVQRGLARDPADRWPTMRDMLDALARPPLVTPARAAVAVVAALSIAGAVVFAETRHAPDPCIGAGDEWAHAWTDASMTALRARLGDAGTAVAATIDRAFRAYDLAGSRMVHASCEATRVEHTQTEAMFAAREACLADRRDYAAALTHALLDGKPPRLDGALEVASSLPAIEECTSPPALTPETPEQARRRADLQARMAQATIDGYLYPITNLQPYHALADEAHALGLPALESHAALVWARNENDENVEETTLQRAALAGLAARDDAALADAWIRLCFHAGFHVGKYQDALQWAAYAQTALDRLGGDPVREAELLLSRGFTLIFVGRPEDAQKDMQRAHELFVQARGPDYWRIVVADYGEGGAALAMGKLDEALALYRKARDLATRVAGTASQVYISSSDNEANALALLGKVDEAIAIFDELNRTTADNSWREQQIGLALRKAGRFTEALAHDQQGTRLSESENETGQRAAYAPLGVGLDLLGLGRAGEALPLLSHALDLESGGPPDEVAEAKFALARALRATGGDPHRAHDLATSARELIAPLATKYGSIFLDTQREIDAWLGAAH